MKSYNKKITLSLATLSIIANVAIAWSIGGKDILLEHPLQLDDRSTDNGGLLPAIETATDGVGAIIGTGDDIYNVDNSAFNDVVYVFGDAAADSGLTLAEYILTQPDENNENGEYDIPGKILIEDSQLNGLTPEDGTACDDYNSDTVNDVYTDGICIGTCDDGRDDTKDEFVDGACVFTVLYPDGTPCDDGDAETINDSYTDQVCSGINVEGESCDDNNPQTINDIYHNGVCLGTDVEGQSCNDGNIQTINDVYVNGVCTGEDVEGQSCNDNNPQTINDIYINGICIGENVEGQSCDDGDANTVDDTYKDGVCLGHTCAPAAPNYHTVIVDDTCTLVPNDGVSCDDQDPNTENDVYTNGVCSGTLIDCDDGNPDTTDTLTNGVCSNTIIDGTICDDGDDTTINDVYTNGICSGEYMTGDCDDGNSQTINDVYVNGVCTGENVEGQSCDDGNVNTINDIYVNGECIGTYRTGNCDDGNIQTINDQYNSIGVCEGDNVEGQSCDDGNIQTINDVYVNGICIGDNVEGQSCNDRNSYTTDDVYHNGICKGTPIPTATLTVNTPLINGADLIGYKLPYKNQVAHDKKTVSFTINNYIQGTSRAWLTTTNGGSPKTDIIPINFRKSYGFKGYMNDLIKRADGTYPTSGSNITFDIGTFGNWRGADYDVYLCIRNTGQVDPTECKRIIDGVEYDGNGLEPDNFYYLSNYTSTLGFKTKAEVSCYLESASSGNGYSNRYSCQ